MVFCGAFAAFSVSELNLISLLLQYPISVWAWNMRSIFVYATDNLSIILIKSGATRTLLSTSPALLLLPAPHPSDFMLLYRLIQRRIRTWPAGGTSLFYLSADYPNCLAALLKIIRLRQSFRRRRRPVWTFKTVKKTGDRAAPLCQTDFHRNLCYRPHLHVLTFNVKTDFNPMNLRDPNTESLSLKNLMKDKETTPRLDRSSQG